MKHWDQVLSRRAFLTQTGSLCLFLSGCAALWRAPGSLPQSASTFGKLDWLRELGPIDRTGGDVAPKHFTGDNFSTAHAALWNAQDWLRSKRIAAPELQTDLVIVGGGMSGLFTAYQLRDYKPVILEQAARFGGNAKGESWRGMDYSIGAAYIDRPDPGSPMDQYYQELGFGDIFTERSGVDPVESNGKLYSNFWDGELATTPASKAPYQKVAQFLSDLCAKRNTEAFPSIPALNGDTRQTVQHYDQWDLHALLSRQAGGTLPAELETALEHYCWSTYAASSKEISAAAALNFLAQESKPICVAAGGNSRMGERILERLLETVPSSHLRTRSTVLEVRAEEKSVKVVYMDGQGELKQIRSRAAVLCCPKFVVKRILADISKDRLEAIQQLRYRAYMVANVLVNKKANETVYDVFLTGKGKTDLRHTRDAQNKQNATDFVIANFAARGHDFSVLTLYRAFPFDGARSELIQPDAYEKYRHRFEAQISNQILPLLGLHSKQVVDIRLTRWGHALPVASTGFFQGNTVDQLRKPHRERVFFVEQDNWAYPATQTGGIEAHFWRDSIRKVLGPPSPSDATA